MWRSGIGSRFGRSLDISSHMLHTQRGFWEPELMNPVTGEIKKIARYEATANGTKIEINVNDPADSFFVLFREKAVAPSVVKATASATELDLFYNDKNELVAETGRAGTYTLTMSDGKTRSVTIAADSKSVQITGWKTESTDNEGFTETRVTEFFGPSGFGNGQRAILDFLIPVHRLRAYIVRLRFSTLRHL